MEAILISIVKILASYGIGKGLDWMLKERETFEKQLIKIIHETINEFEKKYPEGDTAKQFSFYNSEILIEELLKFRLFSCKGHEFSVSQIEKAFEKNPRIVKPTKTQLEEFFKIFDEKVITNDELKKLEIDSFHKEKIFEISEKINSIQSFLASQLTEMVGLLEEEYKAQIEECFDEIDLLRPRTALKRIDGLEKRIELNSKHVTDKLKANLAYIQAVCFEGVGESKKSYELFIQAYMLSPENHNYMDKACISYFFLKNGKFKTLKTLIESRDDYSATCWAIDAIEANDLLNFLKHHVPDVVLSKQRFRQLVFNQMLKRDDLNILSVIESLKIDPESQDLPDIISYDNFHSWIFKFNIGFITFFTNNKIPYVTKLPKSENLLYLLKLGQKISDSINKGELADDYNKLVINTLWIESELNIQINTISRLKETYENLKTKDNHTTLLLALAVQKDGSKNDAISIIDNFQGEIDEYLISLKAFCKLGSHDLLEIYNDYFSIIRTVNEINIDSICAFLLGICHTRNFDYDSLIPPIEKLNFTKRAYEELLRLLILSYSSDRKTHTLEEINNLRNDLAGENDLSFYLALILYENGYFLESADFIKSYADEPTESRDLFLRIRALNEHKTSDQTDLLRLLKHWRANFSFNDYLLRIEIELNQILKNWDEIFQISNYGLKEMPNDEGFFTAYLASLNVLGKKDILKNEVAKIADFTFLITSNALIVSNILLSNGYINEGLEIVYQKAKSKSDIEARTTFFMISSDYYDGYFEEFDTVAVGRYVKYEVAGNQQTIFLNDETKDDPIFQPSIGRKVSEKYYVQRKMTSKLHTVTILRVMNKNLALWDEIFEETKSPYSNLPMEPIEFDGTDKTNIVKTLIENFGASQTLEKKETEKRFNDYYSYNLSFTELVFSVFDGNYIEAYYHLTSPKNRGFCLLPLHYVSRSISSGLENTAIDFSSGLLFYELSKEFGLDCGKFIIAESLLEQIDRTISKAKFEQKSSVAITVSENSVIPHFFGKEFHESRIKYLNDIKEWFLNNTISVTPTERIDLARPLYNNDQPSPAFKLFVDIGFLAQRSDFVLISDDIGFHKLLNIGEKVMTTEHFLINKFPDKKTVILEYLLYRRYLGISLIKDTIYSSYINRHKIGHEHIYLFALRNIGLKISSTPFMILETIDFLQKVALNSLIPKEKFRSLATNVIVFLISGFPNQSFFVTLRKRLEEKFRLLGVYYDLVGEALEDALSIIDKSKV